MLKIGDFSKLSRISVRMLRHYAENHLLMPAEIDKWSGYRYYDESQLRDAYNITTLRDLGFGIEAIKDILSHDDEHRLKMFISHRDELKREYDLLGLRLDLLDSEIRKSEAGTAQKGNLMNYEITEKIIPESYAATVRMTLPNYQCEGMVWSTLVSEIAEFNIPDDDDCLCSVVYLDGEYKEENIEIEARKTVKGHYPDTEHVKFKTIPAVRCATVIHRGSYSTINDAYVAVAEWIHENGFRPAGNMFNIYHVSPHETSDSTKFVTEICYPIEK